MIVPGLRASRLRRTAIAAFACALASASASPTGTLTIDHILSFRTIQGLALSPDGSQVAFVVVEPSEEMHSRAPTNTELYIRAMNGPAEIRLTIHPGRDSDPQWAPGGASLAFLSEREGARGAQIYSINPDGGNLRQLSHHATPVGGFAWSPDGSQIAYLAIEPPSEAQQQRLKRGDDEISLDSFDTNRNAPPQKLWLLDVHTGRTHGIRTGNDHITNVAWSPDGRAFLLTAADDANLDHEWTRSKLLTVPSAGGTPKLYCATRGKLVKAGWLPDGNAISFLGAAADGTEQSPGSLFVCRGSGSAPQDLTEGRSFTVQGYRWMPGGSSAVLSIVQKNIRQLASLDVGTRKVKAMTFAPDVVSGEVSLSATGHAIAYTIERPDRPPDIWGGPLARAPRQLTRLNHALESIRYGATEEIDWKARDGWEISGVVVKPVGYREGTRYPAIVQVHGGPESADLNGFQIQWAQLFAAHGYAVFLPNYRGSVGRGVRFTIANHNDRGGKDFFDILDGVDALVAKGLADPDRLAIGGWSYGGFMSSWAVTQTNRFKASVVGVGITDWFSLMGMAPVPMWNAEAHFLVWHYDDPNAYWRFSPAVHVKKARTPTLMLWGERDPFVPPAQGLEFFRGLRRYGVDSEMIIYPREGHGLREPLHRRNAYTRVLNWYERYVKNGRKEAR